jgi:hypothetical protein
MHLQISNLRYEVLVVVKMLTVVFSFDTM